MTVIHVLEPLATSGDGLWGKERVVELLMTAQRDSGAVVPRLSVFSPCALQRTMQARGFSVDVLDEKHHRLPTTSLPALIDTLRKYDPAVVHTHGYKANIVGRMARICRAPMRALVATCHGWPNETEATRFYNAADRRTAFLSDMTTVPDAHMLQRFSRRVPCTAIANALPDITLATPAARAAARASFGLPAECVVFGFVGRTSVAKGVLELLEAARRTVGEPIVWAIAGSGDLAETIAGAALPNVKFFGYVAEAERFRAAIDVFVQTSHSEALSLSLLEAMRAGLPIIATDVGSTTSATRDGVEACIVAPKDVDGLVKAARTFACDPEFAATLGAAARRRFLEQFHIERQHRAFLELYRSCAKE